MSGNVKGLSGRLIPKSPNLRPGLENMRVSREALLRSVPFAATHLDANVLDSASLMMGRIADLGIPETFQEPASMQRDLVNALTSIHLKRVVPTVLDPAESIKKVAEDLAPLALPALAIATGGALQYVAAGYRIGEAIGMGLERLIPDNEPTNNPTPEMKLQSGDRGGAVVGGGIGGGGKAVPASNPSIDGSRFLDLKPWARTVYLGLMSAGKREEAVAYLEEQLANGGSIFEDDIAEAIQVAEEWERSKQAEWTMSELASDQTEGLITSWYRGIPASLKRVPNPENIVFRYYTDQAGLAAIFRSSELVTDERPLIVTPDKGEAEIGARLVYNDVHGIVLNESDAERSRPEPRSDRKEYVDLRLRPGVPVFKVEIPGMNPTYIIPGRYNKKEKTGTKIRVSPRGSSELGKHINETVSHANRSAVSHADRFAAWKGASAAQMIQALGTYGAPEVDGYEHTDHYYKPLQDRSGAPSQVEVRPVEFDEQEEGLLKFTWPCAEGQSVKISVPLGQNGNNGNSDLHSDLTARVENGKHVIEVGDIEVKGRKVRPSVAFLTVSFQEGISELKPGEVVRPVAGDKVRVRFRDNEIDLNEVYYLRVPFTLQGNTDPSKIPDIFDQIGDAVITVPTYKGDKYVRVVRTEEFFRKLVRWKMAFSVFRVKGSGRPILTLANWVEREKASAHNLMRGGLDILAGEFNPDPRHWNGPKALKWINSGNLKVAPAKEREAGNYDFVVYELPGTPMYANSSGTALSSSAKEVEAALQEIFPNLKIAFIKEEEEDPFATWGSRR